MVVHDYTPTRVPVIASFAADGKIIPLYVQVTYWSEKINLAVHVISSEMNTSDYIDYVCEYEQNNYKKRIKLTYRIKDHAWTIAN